MRVYISVGRVAAQHGTQIRDEPIEAFGQRAAHLLGVGSFCADITCGDGPQAGEAIQRCFQPGLLAQNIAGIGHFGLQIRAAYAEARGEYA